MVCWSIRFEVGRGWARSSRRAFSNPTECNLRYMHPGVISLFMHLHGTIVDPVLVCARAGSRFAVLRHRGRERVRDTGEQRDHEMQDSEFRVRVRTGGSMGGRRWNGLHGRRGLR